MARVGHPRAEMTAQRLLSVPDLAFAREEHEDVARPGRVQLVDRLAQRCHRVAVLPRLGRRRSRPRTLRAGRNPARRRRRPVVRRVVVRRQRPVPDLDRVRPPGHLDNRSGHAVGVLGARRAREVRGEPRRVDRRGRDDQLEVRAAGEEPREVPEDEVDVQRTLMRLVDDERVVGAQHRVTLDLREQDAVGHDLDERSLARLVREPHLVADQLAERRPQLERDALRDGPGRDPPGLRVADLPVAPAAELEQDLRDLRRLPRPGLTRDDDDLVVADRRGDLVAAGRDRQLLGVDDGRDDDGASGLRTAGRLATGVAALAPAVGCRVGYRRAGAPSTATSTGRACLVGRRRLVLACDAHDGPFSLLAQPRSPRRRGPPGLCAAPAGRPQPRCLAWAAMSEHTVGESSDAEPTSGEDRATAALDASGVSYWLARHGRVGSLAEAAAARGVTPADIIKTLVVRRGEDDYLFVLVPGDRTISWPKLRALLGVSRLSMPDAATAMAVTGYERGTITPFGSLRAWPVIADEQVAGRTVSIGAGAHGVAATIDGTALVGALGATTADVTEPEPE